MIIFSTKIYDAFQLTKLKKKKSKSDMETHYQSYSIKIVEYWAYFPKIRICNQETSEVI